ncbi:tyrosine-protein kinase family protein [Aureimonas phyllosphaerae]|uniref:Cellulose biosynthesis protein BcsQ n=1 Tax=Aureimonas phyllosphaerae TaxID=1166078 RepID=A0A7W6BY21_9HYPH|nr:AAA family ATPase [Aureimonas phyllosphaerae]MBB3937243.1 cellulose biosynthesis protein BcsQ [Aureimonas phyllosphaerae]MBB3961120.1 cellulose biosynthesis protein BcsQ [Aureimonas phyllosphaerae]SFF49317.1 CobQ/CobB/MinD/ParA nucleotide binding domain-containing protein [Aureimonas phyllosphaerae]
MTFSRSSGWISVSSLKGGVGCTTVCAGLAMAMARFGLRVLAVDWDTRQPSLHRLLGLRDDAIHTRRGAVDYLRDCMKPRNDGEPLDLARYVYESIPLPDGVTGTIDVMPAGALDRDYWKTVRDFSWDEFYAESGGYGAMEALRLETTDRYDVVLADVGTIREDAANVALLQLSDVAVMMFQADDTMMAATVNAVTQLRHHSGRMQWGRPILRCLLIPARIDRSSDRLRGWLYKSSIQTLLRQNDDGSDDIRTEAIEKNAIGLEPTLSIGETDVRSAEFASLGNLRDQLTGIATTILSGNGVLDHRVDDGENWD